MRRTLFVGDVHGCAAALERVITDAHADRVILVGDIFPKGPDPARTWAVIRDLGAEAVMGNHDERLIAAWGRDGESIHHRTWRRLDEAARAWLIALPLSFAEEGWRVVHAGVHPSLGFPGTTRSMALTMRRWPDDGDPENPFWWELYRGEPRIVYGHDALRGVQVHEHSVGLDSGCVYGGRLSGLVIETEELYQSDKEGNRVG